VAVTTTRLLSFPGTPVYNKAQETKDSFGAMFRGEDCGTGRRRAIEMSLAMRLRPRGVQRESVDVWLDNDGTGIAVKPWKAGMATRAKYEWRY
jgi:hypothetical protein